LSAEQGAFRDKKIGIPGKFCRVLAVTGIGAITYDLTVNFKPVAKTL
jgi:hypothetical protein